MTDGGCRGVEALIPRSRDEIAPGVVHLPDWLDLAGQRRLVAACREWARPPAGLRAARLPGGAVMSVQTVCLGWHWHPYRDAAARMGLHQDRDERTLDPVVSLSLGDGCVFRFGNTENRSRPWRDLELRSGDLVVFGGPSRLAFHGVPKILPGTGNPETGLSGGRLNITVRVSGLA